MACAWQKGHQSLISPQRAHSLLAQKAEELKKRRGIYDETHVNHAMKSSLKLISRHALDHRCLKWLRLASERLSLAFG